MKSAVLFPSMTFPPLLFFAYLAQGIPVNLEAFENYQKRSLRNRYYILGANGPQLMSIPLEGGKNSQCPIREVRISHAEPWQELHLKSIRAVYGKSAFFSYYIDDLARLFKKGSAFLWSFNRECIQFALEKIELEKQPGTTASYTANYEGCDYRNAKINDFCLTTGQLYSNLHGENCLRPEKPLSILDLLFCLGPESQVVLKQIKINQ